MTPDPISSWQMGETVETETMETVMGFIFLDSKSLLMVTAAMKLKDACSLEEKLWQNRQLVKKQRHHFASKGPYSQIYVFSSSHVLMWELDHKECWVPKNWCFRTPLLEKTLESPLDCKESTPINHKENQPWIFIGRSDAEAEAPIHWPPDMKSQLIWKDPDAGKDCRQDEKAMTGDEMAGWHHWLNGQEFEQTLGDGEEQGNLACCDSWGHKESHMTEWLNWTELNTNQIDVSFLFSLCRLSHEFQVFFFRGEEEQTLASTASFVGQNVY